MRQTTLAWIVAASLALIGTLAGHSFAYRIAVPSTHEREHELAESGHGYLEHAASVLPALGAVCLVALVVGALWGRSRCARAPWPMAGLPLLLFAVQEHLERFAHHGEIPWAAALEPTFIVGLLIQLPVGILTWRLARLLLSVARRVVAVVASAILRLSAPARRAGLILLTPRAWRPRHGSALLSAAAGRAPPIWLPI